MLTIPSITDYAQELANQQQRPQVIVLVDNEFRVFAVEPRAILPGADKAVVVHPQPWHGDPASWGDNW